MRLPKKAFSLFLSKKYSRTKFLQKNFNFLEVHRITSIILIKYFSVSLRQNHFFRFSFFYEMTDFLYGFKENICQLILDILSVHSGLF